MSQRVDIATLLSLQRKTENIRNFCILAHVDHGKTTLSDSLVSSNGIISSKLAGKLRFLDSTEEEQKRGITMHSSAISLYYRLEEKGENQSGGQEFLINLVDSPGHIDFSSDVSTAARLCDGALIIVDVLEGVCTQTHAVVYKALKERMKPCLVLNKIDRLIGELRFTPTEAFHHLRRIIENVNALAYTLVNSEYIKANETTSTSADNNIPEDHPMVEEWTFAPEKGNVQFASALDGWGFGLMKFINFWHKKLGLNKAILKKYLFEDYTFIEETKKIIKLDYSDMSKQPMFAALVLQPIWTIYETLLLHQDIQGTANYVKTEV
jgi:ribosome assembly protein 1